ncbi:hypothetical protein BpHYR1_040369 [Brachionus plicatilis]|uniref:Uncharacterized protein n=1 Tax=Brachionus plicatilis TaxID=10195 RepID=A0A3M7PHP5_BRAPC|nr:hypothetical protein BpHYR1_040369 [Brachionus plicatilis]
MGCNSSRAENVVEPSTQPNQNQSGTSGPQLRSLSKTSVKKSQTSVKDQNDLEENDEQQPPQYVLNINVAENAEQQPTQNDLEENTEQQSTPNEQEENQNVDQIEVAQQDEISQN